MRYLTVSVLALLMAGCSSGPSGGMAPYPPSISVNGVGTAEGTADMAIVSFSINVSDSDPGNAVSEATAIAERTIAAASDMGISEEDIETTNYTVYMEEEYDYENYEYTGENIYHLKHSFKVNVRNIDTAGEVLAALVAEGAMVGGLSFTVSNPEELIAEARAIAVANAKEIAGQLAESLDVTLGEPVSVSEWMDYNNLYDPYPYGGYTEDEYYYGAPPVPAGVTSFTMNVSVSYEID